MKYVHLFVILLFAARSLNFPSEINLLYQADLPTITVTAKIVTDEEIELCARLVSAEAGNQSYEGQLAVLDVVYNRLKNNPHKYRSYKDVIFRKGMFDGVGTKYWNNPNSSHYQVAKDKLLNNKRILDSTYEYFHNPITSTDRRWIKRVEKNGCITIQDHVFCKQFK